MGKDVKQDLKTIGLLSVIGGMVLASSFLGYLVGAWLDKGFDTDPWLVVICLTVGVAGGFLQAYRISRKYFKN